MKNYERYNNVTCDEYDKKTLMFYICKVPSDKKILPLIAAIRDKNILDVGLGSGSYTRLLLQNNSVTGIDANPHLCKLPVKLYKGTAAEISKIVKGKKFDLVFSTWMTEYLKSE